MVRLEKLKDTPPWDWPPEAKAQILEVLKDDKALDPEQVLAAELAGEPVVVDDELVHALLAMLADGARSELARSAAAIALGPALELADTEGFDFPDDVPITEPTFQAARKALRATYVDAATPTLVRRRVLEAVVRAPESWQEEEVRAAYASNDPQWKLTAVFCMAFHQGFDDEILEALASKDPQIHRWAVVAAGNSEIDAAWDHVAGLISARKTPKPLLLAAIEASAGIRPEEVGELLEPLADSPDEEIAEAAAEALAMAHALTSEGLEGEDEEVEDEDGEGDGGEGEGGGRLLN